MFVRGGGEEARCYGEVGQSEEYGPEGGEDQEGDAAGGGGGGGVVVGGHCAVLVS